MNESTSKVLAFLFLQGIPSRKEIVMKACDINENELVHSLILLRQTLSSLPFSLLESDTELQIVLTKEMTSYFDHFIKKARDESLTPASLQTLTIIAYLGVASKYEISYIRGVSSTQTIGTLLSKSLIEELSTDKYVLSIEALSHLGVTKKEDLLDFEKINGEFLQKIKNASAL